MADLYRATREELVSLVVARDEAVFTLERRCADLTQQVVELQATVAALTRQLGAQQQESPVGGGTPKGMPGLKGDEAPAREGRVRRRRSRGYGRKRMEPTRFQVHALGVCPECGAPLAGGTVTRRREVIELPPPVVEVTEHVYLERRCPDCRRRCVPGPELAGVVVGQGRFGVRLASLIAVLREEARLPFATIQRLLRTVSGLEVSEGALVGVVQRVAQRAQPAMRELAAAIRASPVVHVDETGWREGGRNGYVWTVSTPEQRFFVRGSRGKAMLATIVGDAFAGVLVSDFYGVYTSYEGVHQYCWAHLLRDIADLQAQHPADPALHGWSAAVGAIFAQAQAAAAGPLPARQQARRKAETTLRRLCAPWQQGDASQRTLCQRMLRHLDGLFVFVTDPAVPPTNNAAERSLRHLVVSRKISGGTRSSRGTATKMTLASLFGTWHAQGINPYTACCELLSSPQI